MKELWLFGPLNTLGEDKVQAKTEDDAKAVAEMLEKLLKERYASDM